ncbi:MAG: LytTR family transcriptional regulator, partial [Bacteroidetes bacterium]|nr:LytTR family transcriptional regulator [Bacteroidota bacterium]
VQGATNYVDFFTTTDKITVRMKLSEAVELVPDSFVQVHRSYLVNLQHVKRVEHNHVIIGDVKIAIGKSWRDEFMERLNEGV